MSLKKFIQQENFTLQFFSSSKEAPMPENPKLLTEEQKKRLADRVSSALSPEVLTCDGELRGSKLMARARMLNKAKAELEALGVTVPAC